MDFDPQEVCENWSQFIQGNLVDRGNTKANFQSSLSLTVRNSNLMLLSLLRVASMLHIYRQSQDYLSGQSGFPDKFLIRGSTGILSST
jgi:hypothetical protein